MLNGDGLRVVLWVAGCSHACPGCQNPVTWDPNGGLPFDAAAKAELFETLGKSYISGITFSGGDPLYLGSRMDLLGLIKEIKEKFGSLDVLVNNAGISAREKIYDYSADEFSKIIDLNVKAVFNCANYFAEKLQNML